MLVQIKIQIERETYELIEESYNDLNYKILSQHIRDTVNAKAREDRRRFRELKRKKAIEIIGKTPYNDLLETIQKEDFQ